MKAVTSSIQSKATGPEEQPLYLHADELGNVTVQYQVTDSARWIFYLDPSLEAVMIVNVASGQVLAVSAENGLTTVPDFLFNDRHRWTFRGDFSKGGGAMRPLFDSGLNLTVDGKTYPHDTPVVLQKWDDKSNQKWTTQQYVD